MNTFKATIDVGYGCVFKTLSFQIWQLVWVGPLCLPTRLQFASVYVADLKTWQEISLKCMLLIFYKLEESMTNVSTRQQRTQTLFFGEKVWLLTSISHTELEIEWTGPLNTQENREG